MEADTLNGETDKGELECWLSSPSLEEFKQRVQDSLTHLADTQADPDSKPSLRIYKYPQFMINVLVRHMLNNNNTDFVNEFRAFSPEDYEIVGTIVDEIRESLWETLFDDTFTCTYVEIFDKDLVAVKIKYEL